jgi:hypothetical protein
VLVPPRQNAHLVGMRLDEGRAGGGARDIVATGGIIRQPVEPIDQAQQSP